MDALILILALLGGLVILFIGYKLGTMVKDQEWIENLPKIKKESLKKSRSVLKGQFSEQLSPYMPDFPYNPTECKFLGKPIDLIVFRGLDDKEPEEIVFVEIKTGNSQLSRTERKLRNLIKEKKVRWEEYRLKS